MCVLFFAAKVHPEYPLIIALNRDEFYSRPTEPAHFWGSHPQVLAGRDLLGGGTWAGISRSGKFAALTNYRDPRSHRHDAPSRGSLVLDYLAGSDGPRDYLHRIRSQSKRFNDFNLLVGDLREAQCFSSRHQLTAESYRGIYGLSNEDLDTPWPKVVAGKQRFSEILAAGSRGEELVEALFGLLRSKQSFPDDLLPDTGIGIARERALSPIFVETEGYGTRSSSVVLFSREGRVSFTEITHPVSGGTHLKSEFSVPLSH